MGYDVRIEEKKFFLWNATLFQGGYEYGCSVSTAVAEYIRALIDVDDDVGDEDLAHLSPPHRGGAQPMRVCYVLRLPRPFEEFVRRHPLSTTGLLAEAMQAEPDVDTAFGYLTERNYIELIGILAKHVVPKGQSCFVLNASTTPIILAANRPPMLIRISGMPTDISPLRPDAA